MASEPGKRLQKRNAERCRVPTPSVRMKCVTSPSASSQSCTVSTSGSEPEISEPKPRISNRLVISTAPSTLVKPETMCASSKIASSRCCTSGSLVVRNCSQVMPPSSLCIACNR